MKDSDLIAKPIFHARRRHRLAPSKISMPMYLFGCFVIPIYLRIVLFFRKIEIREPERVIEAIRDFQEKRTRLIVAFRHPYGDEAQLLSHVFENLVPRYAKKLKKPLPHRTYLRIVHDYAVPLWSNAFIRFLLPRVGALPVYHIKFDHDSLKNIRSVLREGPSPLGIAPEGQVSYHSETLPRIEIGTVRMGFWCASDIEKTSRPEKVLILPISVHCRYDERDLKKIITYIAQMESFCCIDPVTNDSSSSSSTTASLAARIKAIECRLLDMSEDYYRKSYGYKAPDILMPDESEAAARQRRWNALIPFALTISEHALGINSQNDDIVQRMYRIRLEAWERIYPEKPPDRPTPLEAALIDRRTGEAWFAMRHMEFVDIISYHDVTYLEGPQNSLPSFDRIVETVINFVDLVNRLMGGNISNRPNSIRKKAIIVPAPCIDLTEKLPDYHKDSRKTTSDTTDELARLFEDCIRRYKDGT